MRSLPSKLAYPYDHTTRDLRLDFLRGLIMLVVITVHMEYYSFFSLFAWGRVGLVSSAEGFVTLSGIVLGIVYKKRLIKEGFKSSAFKLLKRSFQLYRVNLFVIFSIVLLGKTSFINIFELSHWVPVGDPEQVYPLYPPSSASWVNIVQQALLLRIGPHQFQVIGLYVGLIAIAPLVLCCLYKQKTPWLMIASVTLYGINHLFHFRITGAQFEWGFPLLTWQLLFIAGMIIGYHQEKVLGYIIGEKGKPLLWFASIMSLCFLFVAFNHPNPTFWPWKMLSIIDGATFHQMYLDWFQKTSLGLGKLVNNLSLFIVFYYALSRYWIPINKVLGWLLVPLGQASLYVFFLHIYFILLVNNTPLVEYNNFFINTAMHASTILLIWLMVKYKVLFQIIPR